MLKRSGRNKVIIIWYVIKTHNPIIKIKVKKKLFLCIISPNISYVI